MTPYPLCNGCRIKFGMTGACVIAGSGAGMTVSGLCEVILQEGFERDIVGALDFMLLFD